MKKNEKSVAVIAKQQGWVLLPDNDNYTNRIEIVGSTGNVYIVAQTKKNGIWSCGCLGFRRHRHCKHLTTMLPLLPAQPKSVIRD